MTYRLWAILDRRTQGESINGFKSSICLKEKVTNLEFHENGFRIFNLLDICFDTSAGWTNWLD